MSVGTVGGSSLSGLFAPARTTGTNSRVEEANRAVKADQQQVDQRKADAEKKAQAAQQATSELKAAKAAVAKDQAELNQAKSQAAFDVYT
ncbi:hypothetical protein [Cryptosporangium sp. NPDC048952]|uniref:hypothetical protein n=1 Tax=Cryptosporangium sp. NPDC048952 TaxID=3363961 RepID=UPI003714EB79